MSNRSCVFLNCLLKAESGFCHEHRKHHCKPAFWFHPHQSAISVRHAENDPTCDDQSAQQHITCCGGNIALKHISSFNSWVASIKALWIAQHWSLSWFLSEISSKGFQWKFLIRSCRWIPCSLSCQTMPTIIYGKGIFQHYTQNFIFTVLLWSDVVLAVCKNHPLK